jgi:lipopolysaccharide biosynthesis glycosyltransferase
MPAQPSLLFCFDEAYAAQAAVAMASALRHASLACQVYCLVSELSGASQSQLEALAASHGAALQVIRIDVTPFTDWHVRAHIPRVTYLRLLAPVMIDAPKVLYLDCDLLVTEDWLPLFETPLQDHWIGGAPDPNGAATSQLPRVAGDPYINAGVLLMDLDALRQAGFTDQCVACYRHHGKAVTWLDQCLINKVCEGHKRLISPRWNRMAAAPAMTRRR